MGLFSSFSSGGIGNSQSKNQTTTTSGDLRVVGAEGSVNSSQQLNLDLRNLDELNDSTLTVTSTDYGAVGAALRLALEGIEGAQSVTKETLAANGSLLTGALTMAGEQQKAFTDTVSNIKTSDVRVLIFAGLAVVGLAAVYLFKKGV